MIDRGGGGELHQLLKSGLLLGRWRSNPQIVSQKGHVPLGYSDNY